MTEKQLKNTNHATGRLKIALVVSLVAIIIYLIIALFSFNINDPGWSTVSSEKEIQNYAGPVGAYIASVILSIFGIFGYLIPFFLIDPIRSLLLRNDKPKFNYLMLSIKILGFVILVLAGCALAELYLNFFNYWLPQRSGGIAGYEVAKYFVKYLNNVGGSFILAILFFVGLTLYSGTTWIHICKTIYSFIAGLFSKKPEEKSEKEDFLFGDFNSFQKNDDKALTKNQTPTIIQKPTVKEPEINISNDYNYQDLNDEDEELYFSGENNYEPEEEAASLEEFSEKKTKNKPSSLNKNISLPSLNLLIEPEEKKTIVSKEHLEQTSALLEQTLNDFNISAKVVAAYPGPVITRYEIDLARGTKVSKLTNISQDLARALSTTAVRVVEVIPGKPYVGLELPNSEKQIVRIKEVLSAPEFISSKAPTMMGIGVDISGKPTFAELAKMPHLLVAGTTGSGKSVGVNAMIISMLYKCTPEELRFIMIDPKMLELSIYDGIPHLLTPVVTDMTEAANSLRWCVKEMERRYALMSAAGVRNIALLNDKIERAENAGKPLKDTMFIKMNPERAHEAPTLQKMPYIVVIADEFADMIMVVGKKVEELIARLAQKARAAGIHIILATQRPSVDVVTGLIKANIPTRMSFQVSSRIDSRTILDQQGAEHLLGHGDMLYLKPGLGAPMRVHGAFVDDDEVHRIVESWKSYGEPEYIESITNTADDEGGNNQGADESSEDPLYNEAVEIVIKTQKASISAVQRKLKIGYNRSARLMEEMEENGVVSEMNSNGMRDVLIKRES